MAHINGTFYSAKAGKLRVVLTGYFFIGSGRDGGFFASGTPWIIKAVVNGNSTPACDARSNSVEMTLDYPGNVNWSVTTETVQAGSSGGTASSGVAPITVGFRLLKR